MTTFTIITPTVLRETLLRTCKSVDEQSYGEWQHVVMVDRPEELLTERQQGLLVQVSHPRHEVRFCLQPHKDFGNTCRRNELDYARGLQSFMWMMTTITCHWHWKRSTTGSRG